MTAPAKLRLLLGPAGSGKTGQLLDRFRQALRPAEAADNPLAARRRTLWLAPTQAAADDIRDRLAAAASRAVLDPGVMTFARFAASLVWDTGLRVRVISTLQRRRLLRQVIDEIAAEGALVHFAQVADTPGLVSLVDETIADLKRRDIFVDKFRRQARSGGPRLAELAEIYARYQARLTKAKLVDAEGLFRTARDGLDITPEAASGLELVVVDGFSDFTSAQLDLLSVLAERATETWVALPGDDGAVDAAAARSELFAKTLGTVAALRRFGGVVMHAREDARHGGSSTNEWPAMAHLERNLFRAYRELEPVVGAAAATRDRLRIFAASGVQAEIDHLAREVKQRLISGVAPEEIVVAFRSTQESADRVRQAFDDFGIPFYLDASPRLTASPVNRSLLAVLRLAAEDWPYRRVLQVTGDRSLTIFDAGPSPPPSWSSEPLPPLDSRAAIERCVRYAQLPQGRAALMNQLSAWAAAGEEEVDPPLHSPLRAAGTAHFVLSKFATALDQLPNRGDAGSWIAAVERLSNQLGLVNASTPTEVRAAWDALIAGIRAAAHIDQWTGFGGAELELTKFIQLVATCAAEIPCPGKPAPTGRVRIVSAEAARFLRPKHLLVGGLSEQSFPATAERDLGLDDAGQPDFKSVQSRQEQFRAGEMLLFYQLVTRPTESLTLSYPALDAKAQPLMPSPYLVELERCFAGAPLERTTQPLNYRQHEPSKSAAPMSRGDLRRTAVLQALDGRRELLASLAGSPAAAPTGSAILAGLEAVASRGGREFGSFEGIFSSDAVRLLLEQKFDLSHLWSPSHLETYAGCPFRFFGEQVLKLQPAPELALASDAAHRGAVLHDTLAQLYGRLSELPADQALSPADVARQFKETLEAVMERRTGSGLEAALREIERRQIASWADQFGEQHQRYGAAWPALDEPLAPKHFEYRFGPKRRRDSSTHDPQSTDAPLVISAGDAQFRFTGVVDRIDVGRVGETVVFNVIDYKTAASARVREEDMAAGRQLQLQLYALAVAELLFSGKSAAPLAAGFWSVRGKGFATGGRTKGALALGEIRDGGVSPSESWNQMRDVLLRQIREIVVSIRQGWFPVFNDNPDCGRYCPFSTACRISHVRSLEKEWSPPVETVPKQ